MVLRHVPENQEKLLEFVSGRADGRDAADRHVVVRIGVEPHARRLDPPEELDHRFWPSEGPIAEIGGALRLDRLVEALAARSIHPQAADGADTQVAPGSGVSFAEPTLVVACGDTPDECPSLAVSPGHERQPDRTPRHEALVAARRPRLELLCEVIVRLVDNTHLGTGGLSFMPDVSMPNTSASAAALRRSRPARPPRLGRGRTNSPGDVLGTGTSGRWPPRDAMLRQKHRKDF